MSTTYRLPMNEETRIDLEDCFVDEANTDARQFVFQQIKNACQDAKRSDRSKTTPINQRQDDGTMKQEEYPLKGVKLDNFTLNDNPKWLPKNMEEEDNKPIELKLGDKTMKYLKIFGQLVTIRHEQYNTYEDKYMEIQKDEMKDRISDPKSFERFLSTQKNQRENRLEQVPTCLEHAIFVSIWPAIQQKIDASDGKMFEDEYKEIYKEVAEEKSKKPTPSTP